MVFYLETALVSALRIKLKHIYNKIKIRVGGKRREDIISD